MIGWDSCRLNGSFRVVIAGGSLGRTLVAPAWALGIKSSANGLPGMLAYFFLRSTPYASSVEAFRTIILG